MNDSCKNFPNRKWHGRFLSGLIGVLLMVLVTPLSSWGEKFHFKDGATVTVKKEIFICDLAVGVGERDFRCYNFYEGPNFTDRIPFGPNSEQLDRYVSCASVEACRAMESNFRAQIFKTVAHIPELSSKRTKTNLGKIHYIVTEDEVDDRIETTSGCFAAGFRHEESSLFLDSGGQELVNYEFCVDYVGDCSGTLRSYDKKTCTIQNYIFRGIIQEKSD